jgi:hypothetical protein
MYKLKSVISRSLFLIVSIGLCSFDQPKLVKTKVAENITVSIPEGWKPMDALDFNERYPSVRAPIAAYTNHERMADLSVNISATQWPDANLELAQKFFKSSLMNMFDRVEMIEEGIREVHKKKFVYFIFESRVNGNRTDVGQNDAVTRYTYMQYLIEPKRTLVFSFSCPKRERQNWESTAKSIMNSVKVK